MLLVLKTTISSPKLNSGNRNVLDYPNYPKPFYRLNLLTTKWSHWLQSAYLLMQWSRSGHSIQINMSYFSIPTLLSANFCNSFQSHTRKKTLTLICAALLIWLPTNTVLRISSIESEETVHVPSRLRLHRQVTLMRDDELIRSSESDFHLVWVSLFN